jgi:uncharacterized protein
LSTRRMRSIGALALFASLPPASASDPVPSPAARLGRKDAALVAVMVVVFAALPLGASRAAWAALALGMSALTALAFVRRCLPAARLGAFATLVFVVLAALGSMNLWPLPPALAAAAFLIVSKRVSALGIRERWLRRGRLDAASGALIVTSMLVSAVALVVWFAVAHPDYRALRGTLFPDVSLPLLAMGVILFACVNAAVEELVYRGAVMGALDEAFGPGVVSLLVQALAFGVLHLHGFPSGAVGVALATIYGLMMGLVRRHANGMLAPWIAHVGTDIAIGSILIRALY